MSERKTLYQKRQDQKARRNALREQGICIVCSTNQAGLNYDGTQSVRCTDCRDKLTARRSRDKVVPYSRNSDPDYDNRETPEFRDYAAKVTELVRASGDMGVCTNDVHNVLGRKYQHFTLCAIKSIPHIQKIAECPVDRYCINPDARQMPDYAAVNFSDFTYIYSHRERGVYSEREES